MPLTPRPLAPLALRLVEIPGIPRVRGVQAVGLARLPTLIRGGRVLSDERPNSIRLNTATCSDSSEIRVLASANDSSARSARSRQYATSVASPVTGAKGTSSRTRHHHQTHHEPRPACREQNRNPAAAPAFRRTPRSHHTSPPAGTRTRHARPRDHQILTADP